MYSFEARVISGHGRGQKIGFPTANLDKKKINIKHGVYLAEVEVDAEKYSALLHFGEKKTFDEGVSLELYIKNFNFNIYNRKVSVTVIKKIRDIRKFKNEEELKKQIKRDVMVLSNK